MRPIVNPLSMGVLLWCLLAPASAEEAGTPADTATSGAGAAPAIDFGGWDWSGVSDTAPQSPTRKKKTLDPNKPRVGETAAPDFDAEPKSVYEVFAGMPTFKVVPSTKDPDMHPCADCHDWAESDPTPRDLKEPHDNFALQHGLHGKGKFWCFTCHTLEGDGGLQTLEGDKLDFDDAYLVCSQCHSRQARDWVHGGHGKRAGNWDGERAVYNCTDCHYQHRPGLKPREPKSGPVVRQGLDMPEHWAPKAHVTPRLWDKYANTGGSDAH